MNYIYNNIPKFNIQIKIILSFQIRPSTVLGNNIRHNTYTYIHTYIHMHIYTHAHIHTLVFQIDRVGGIMGVGGEGGGVAGTLIKFRKNPPETTVLHPPLLLIFENLFHPPLLSWPVF